LRTINFIDAQNTVIFESLRLKIARVILRRKAAKMKRQKILFDFASAKYVGVLCAPQDEASTGHLKIFLHYLSQKGIKYSVFGYFDGKKIPENFLYWTGMDFMTRQDLNFFFVPKSPMVDKFISEPFDMLINCNLADYFPIEYLSQLSMAKCKVSIMREDESCYDLMIDIQKNPTIEYFLKNLEVYLSNLRHPQ
jgi:hypothetical protein